MVVIKKNIIYYNNFSFFFEDLFTINFFKYSDEVCHKYRNDNFCVNEIYNSFILPYLALNFFVEGNSIIRIDYSKADCFIYSLCNDLEYNSSSREKKYTISSFKKIYTYLNRYILQLSSALYLTYKMIRIPYRKCQIINKKFSILRSKGGQSKFKNFDITTELEDFNDRSSIYRLIPVARRLKWVWLSYTHSFKELNSIKKLVNEYIGENTSLFVQRYYSIRVVHTLLYYHLIDYCFSLNTGKKFYTANNLDRYSVIEEKLATKYNIETFCIPHGLEYGFKFPKGFSCDIHYTNSEYAAAHLNKLYDTKKFVFDKSIANKMFKKDYVKFNNEYKVVYFSEPREVYVNQHIIEKLVPLLEEKNIKLYLKLHPKDKLSDYSKYGLKLIEHLDEAITGNICISRKSTTLLEATYNSSVVAAVLLNAKDESTFYTFPSLQDERIKITKSIQELYDWIIIQYKLKNNLYNEKK